MLMKIRVNHATLATGTMICLQALATNASFAATAPPPANKIEDKQNYFGTEILDSYKWMEEGFKSKEFLDYLRAQNEYTRNQLNELGTPRQQLLSRIRELDAAVPIVRYWQRANSRIFYLETATDTLSTALMMLDTSNGKTSRVLDPRSLAKKGQHASLDYYAPSPDGRYVAAGISLGGSENSTIHIVDVNKNKFLPESITRTQYGYPTWTADSKGFYYSRLQELPEDAGQKEIYENERVFFHKLRSFAEADVPIFGSGLGDVQISKYGFIGAMTDRSSPFVVAFHSTGTSDHQTVYFTQHTEGATTRWTQIISKEDELAASGLTMHGNLIYALTEKNAPNRQLISIDLSQPGLQRKVIVPQSERLLIDAYCAKDALYLKSKQGIKYFLQRFPFDKFDQPENIELPFEGVISNVDANAEINGIMFRLESWIEPGQAFIYDPLKHKMSNTMLVKKHPADFSKIEAQEITIDSTDGAKVPVTIIKPKDMPMNGLNPCILVAYGAYGIPIEPNYDPTMLSWLEKSGMFAIVHARGGGELGVAWHEAGKKKTKQHTIDDVIASSEYLISNKYTSSQKLTVKGTSAGGIACGGAITQRPELFAVAIDNVGMTDMIGFQQTQGGEANIPEFGDLNKKEEFEALHAMSAYHHIKDGTKYPALLGITGANDPRVPSWIIAKMVARVREASISGKPALLRVDFDAGHGNGSNRTQRQRQMADERSFILWQTGDPKFQPATVDDFEENTTEGQH